MGGGGYLLLVVSPPWTPEHKEPILQRVAKGLLSWDVKVTGTDLTSAEKACLSVKVSTGHQNELLIQHSTETLAVEVLLHPEVSTLRQCFKNMMVSGTVHKHVVHAGYAFAGSGDWILQDGVFGRRDVDLLLSDPEVHQMLKKQRRYKLHVHCAAEGAWTQPGLSLNPPDIADHLAGSGPLISCLDAALTCPPLSTILPASSVVGNIRFRRPTLYVFPGGQGDCALFGVSGFTLLVDGGFSRRPCFWEFVRHLDRLDALLVTRFNQSNVCGLAALAQRKMVERVYPQVGYVFCNASEGQASPSDEEIKKDRDELLVSVVDQGFTFVNGVKQMGLNPQPCFRNPDPLILYHKVGQGTLEMYVLSPPPDSKETTEFLQKWRSNLDEVGTDKTSVPLCDVASVCALLVWRPAQKTDTVTRILLPGSAPQGRIFEGLRQLDHLGVLRSRTVTTEACITLKRPKVPEKMTRAASVPPRMTAAKKPVGKPESPSRSPAPMERSKVGRVPTNKVIEQIAKKQEEEEKEKKPSKRPPKKVVRKTISDQSEKADQRKTARRARSEEKTQDKDVEKEGDSEKSVEKVAETLAEKTTEKVEPKKATSKPAPKTKGAKEVTNKKAVEAKAVSRKTPEAPKAKPRQIPAKAPLKDARSMSPASSASSSPRHGPSKPVAPARSIRGGIKPPKSETATAVVEAVQKEEAARKLGAEKAVSEEKPVESAPADVILVEKEAVEKEKIKDDVEQKVVETIPKEHAVLKKDVVEVVSLAQETPEGVEETQIQPEVGEVKMELQVATAEVAIKEKEPKEKEIVETKEATVEEIITAPDKEKTAVVVEREHVPDISEKVMEAVEKVVPEAGILETLKSEDIDKTSVPAREEKGESEKTIPTEPEVHEEITPAPLVETTEKRDVEVTQICPESPKEEKLPSAEVLKDVEPSILSTPVTEKSRGALEERDYEATPEPTDLPLPEGVPSLEDELLAADGKKRLKEAGLRHAVDADLSRVHALSSGQRTPDSLDTPRDDHEALPVEPTTREDILDAMEKHRLVTKKEVAEMKRRDSIDSIEGVVEEVPSEMVAHEKDVQVTLHEGEPPKVEARAEEIAEVSVSPDISRQEEAGQKDLDSAILASEVGAPEESRQEIVAKAQTSPTAVSLKEGDEFVRKAGAEVGTKEEPHEREIEGKEEQKGAVLLYQQAEEESILRDKTVLEETVITPDRNHERIKGSGKEPSEAVEPPETEEVTSVERLEGGIVPRGVGVEPERASQEKGGEEILPDKTTVVEHREKVTSVLEPVKVAEVQEITERVEEQPLEVKPSEEQSVLLEEEPQRDLTMRPSDETTVLVTDATAVIDQAPSQSLPEAPIGATQLVDQASVAKAEGERILADMKFTEHDETKESPKPSEVLEATESVPSPPGLEKGPLAGTEIEAKDSDQWETIQKPEKRAVLVTKTEEIFTPDSVAKGKELEITEAVEQLSKERLVKEDVPKVNGERELQAETEAPSETAEAVRPPGEEAEKHGALMEEAGAPIRIDDLTKTDLGKEDLRKAVPEEVVSVLLRTADEVIEVSSVLDARKLEEKNKELLEETKRIEAPEEVPKESVTVTYDTAPHLIEETISLLHGIVSEPEVPPTADTSEQPLTPHGIAGTRMVTEKEAAKIVPLPEDIVTDTQKATIVEPVALPDSTFDVLDTKQEGVPEPYSPAEAIPTEDKQVLMQDIFVQPVTMLGSAAPDFAAKQEEAPMTISPPTDIVSIKQLPMQEGVVHPVATVHGAAPEFIAREEPGETYLRTEDTATETEKVRGVAAVSERIEEDTDKLPYKPHGEDSLLETQIPRRGVSEVLEEGRVAEGDRGKVQPEEEGVLPESIPPEEVKAVTESRASPPVMIGIGMEPPSKLFKPIEAEEKLHELPISEDEATKTALKQYTPKVEPAEVISGIVSKGVAPTPMIPKDEAEEGLPAVPEGVRDTQHYEPDLQTAKIAEPLKGDGSGLDLDQSSLPVSKAPTTNGLDGSLLLEADSTIKPKGRPAPDEKEAAETGAKLDEYLIRPDKSYKVSSDADNETVPSEAAIVSEPAPPKTEPFEVHEAPAGIHVETTSVKDVLAPEGSAAPLDEDLSRGLAQATVPTAGKAANEGEAAGAGQILQAALPTTVDADAFKAAMLPNEPSQYLEEVSTEPTVTRRVSDTEKRVEDKLKAVKAVVSEMIEPHEEEELELTVDHIPKEPLQRESGEPLEMAGFTVTDVGTHPVPSEPDQRESPFSEQPEKYIQPETPTTIPAAQEESAVLHEQKPSEGLVGDKEVEMPPGEKKMQERGELEQLLPGVPVREELVEEAAVKEKIISLRETLPEEEQPVQVTSVSEELPSEKKSAERDAALARPDRVPLQSTEDRVELSAPKQDESGHGVQITKHEEVGTILEPSTIPNEREEAPTAKKEPVEDTITKPPSTEGVTLTRPDIDASVAISKPDHAGGTADDEVETAEIRSPEGVPLPVRDADEGKREVPSAQLSGPEERYLSKIPDVRAEPSIEKEQAQIISGEKPPGKKEIEPLETPREKDTHPLEGQGTPSHLKRDELPRDAVQQPEPGDRLEEPAPFADVTEVVVGKAVPSAASVPTEEQPPKATEEKQHEETPTQQAEEVEKASEGRTDVDTSTRDEVRPEELSTLPGVPGAVEKEEPLEPSELAPPTKHHKPWLAEEDGTVLKKLEEMEPSPLVEGGLKRYEEVVTVPEPGPEPEAQKLTIKEDDVMKVLVEAEKQQKILLEIVEQLPLSTEQTGMDTQLPESATGKLEALRQSEREPSGLETSAEAGDETKKREERGYTEGMKIIASPASDVLPEAELKKDGNGHKAVEQETLLSDKADEKFKPSEAGTEDTSLTSKPEETGKPHTPPEEKTILDSAGKRPSEVLAIKPLPAKETLVSEPKDKAEELTMAQETVPLAPLLKDAALERHEVPSPDQMEEASVRMTVGLTDVIDSKEMQVAQETGAMKTDQGAPAIEITEPEPKFPESATEEDMLHKKTREKELRLEGEHGAEIKSETVKKEERPKVVPVEQVLDEASREKVAVEPLEESRKLSEATESREGLSEQVLEETTSSGLAIGTKTVPVRDAASKEVEPQVPAVQEFLKKEEPYVEDKPSGEDVMMKGKDVSKMQGVAEKASSMDILLKETPEAVSQEEVKRPGIADTEKPAGKAKESETTDDSEGEAKWALHPGLDDSSEPFFPWEVPKDTTQGETIPESHASLTDAGLELSVRENAPSEPSLESPGEESKASLGPQLSREQADQVDVSEEPRERREHEVSLAETEEEPPVTDSLKDEREQYELSVKVELTGDTEAKGTPHVPAVEELRQEPSEKDRDLSEEPEKGTEEKPAFAVDAAVSDKRGGPIIEDTTVTENGAYTISETQDSVLPVRDTSKQGDQQDETPKSPLEAKQQLPREDVNKTKHVSSPSLEEPPTADVDVREAPKDISEETLLPPAISEKETSVKESEQLQPTEDTEKDPKQVPVPEEVPATVEEATQGKGGTRLDGVTDSRTLLPDTQLETVVPESAHTKPPAEYPSEEGKPLGIPELIGIQPVCSGGPGQLDVEHEKKASLTIAEGKSPSAESPTEKGETREMSIAPAPIEEVTEGDAALIPLDKAAPMEPTVVTEKSVVPSDITCEPKIEEAKTDKSMLRKDEEERKVPLSVGTPKKVKETAEDLATSVLERGEVSKPLGVSLDASATVPSELTAQKISKDIGDETPGRLPVTEEEAPVKDTKGAGPAKDDQEVLKQEPFGEDSPRTLGSAADVTRIKEITKDTTEKDVIRETGQPIALLLPTDDVEGTKLDTVLDESKTLADAFEKPDPFGAPTEETRDEVGKEGREKEGKVSLTDDAEKRILTPEVPAAGSLQTKEVLEPGGEGKLSDRAEEKKYDGGDEPFMEHPRGEGTTEKRTTASKERLPSTARTGKEPEPVLSKLQEEGLLPQGEDACLGGKIDEDKRDHGLLDSGRPKYDLQEEYSDKQKMEPEHEEMIRKVSDEELKAVSTLQDPEEKAILQGEPKAAGMQLPTHAEDTASLTETADKKIGDKRKPTAAEDGPVVPFPVSSTEETFPSKVPEKESTPKDDIEFPEQEPLVKDLGQTDTPQKPAEDKPAFEEHLIHDVVVGKAVSEPTVAQKESKAGEEKSAKAPKMESLRKDDIGIPEREALMRDVGQTDTVQKFVEDKPAFEEHLIHGVVVRKADSGPTVEQKESKPEDEKLAKASQRESLPKDDVAIPEQELLLKDLGQTAKLQKLVEDKPALQECLIHDVMAGKVDSEPAVVQKESKADEEKLAKVPEKEPVLKDGVAVPVEGPLGQTGTGGKPAEEKSAPAEDHSESVVYAKTDSEPAAARKDSKAEEERSKKVPEKEPVPIDAAVAPVEEQLVTEYEKTDSTGKTVEETSVLEDHRTDDIGSGKAADVTEEVEEKLLPGARDPMPTADKSSLKQATEHKEPDSPIKAGHDLGSREEPDSIAHGTEEHKEPKKTDDKDSVPKSSTVGEPELTEESEEKICGKAHQREQLLNGTAEKETSPENLVGPPAKRKETTETERAAKEITLTPVTSADAATAQTEHSPTVMSVADGRHDHTWPKTTVPVPEDGLQAPVSGREGSSKVLDEVPREITTDDGRAKEELPVTRARQIPPDTGDTTTTVGEADTLEKDKQGADDRKETLGTALDQRLTEEDSLAELLQKELLYTAAKHTTEPQRTVEQFDQKLPAASPKDSQFAKMPSEIKESAKVTDKVTTPSDAGERKASLTQERHVLPILAEIADQPVKDPAAPPAPSDVLFTAGYEVLERKWPSVEYESSIISVSEVESGAEGKSAVERGIGITSDVKMTVDTLETPQQEDEKSSQPSSPDDSLPSSPVKKASTEFSRLQERPTSKKARSAGLKARVASQGSSEADISSEEGEEPPMKDVHVSRDYQADSQKPVASSEDDGNDAKLDEKERSGLEEPYNKTKEVVQRLGDLPLERSSADIPTDDVVGTTVSERQEQKDTELDTHCTARVPELMSQPEGRKQAGGHEALQPRGIELPSIMDAHTSSAPKETEFVRSAVLDADVAKTTEVELAAAQHHIGPASTSTHIAEIHAEQLPTVSPDITRPPEVTCVLDGTAVTDAIDFETIPPVCSSDTSDIKDAELLAEYTTRQEVSQDDRVSVDSSYSVTSEERSYTELERSTIRGSDTLVDPAVLATLSVECLSASDIRSEGTTEVPRDVPTTYDAPSAKTPPEHLSSAGAGITCDREEPPGPVPGLAHVSPAIHDTSHDDHKDKISPIEKTSEIAQSEHSHDIAAGLAAALTTELSCVIGSSEIVKDGSISESMLKPSAELCPASYRDTPDKGGDESPQKTSEPLFTILSQASGSEVSDRKDGISGHLDEHRPGKQIFDSSLIPAEGTDDVRHIQPRMVQFDICVEQMVEPIARKFLEDSTSQVTGVSFKETSDYRTVEKAADLEDQGKYDTQFREAVRIEQAAEAAFLECSTAYKEDPQSLFSRVTDADRELQKPFAEEVASGKQELTSRKTKECVTIPDTEDRTLSPSEVAGSTEGRPRVASAPASEVDAEPLCMLPSSKGLHDKVSGPDHGRQIHADDQQPAAEYTERVPERKELVECTDATCEGEGTEKALLPKGEGTLLVEAPGHRGPTSVHVVEHTFCIDTTHMHEAPALGEQELLQRGSEPCRETSESHAKDEVPSQTELAASDDKEAHVALALASGLATELLCMAPGSMSIQKDISDVVARVRPHDGIDEPDGDLQTAEGDEKPLRSTEGETGLKLPTTAEKLKEDEVTQHRTQDTHSTLHLLKTSGGNDEESALEQRHGSTTALESISKHSKVVATTVAVEKHLESSDHQKGIHSTCVPDTGERSRSPTAQHATTDDLGSQVSSVGTTKVVTPSYQEVPVRLSGDQQESSLVAGLAAGLATELVCIPQSARHAHKDTPESPPCLSTSQTPPFHEPHYMTVHRTSTEQPLSATEDEVQPEGGIAIVTRVYKTVRISVPAWIFSPTLRSHTVHTAHETEPLEALLASSSSLSSTDTRPISDVTSMATSVITTPGAKLEHSGLVDLTASSITDSSSEGTVQRRTVCDQGPITTSSGESHTEYRTITKTCSMAQPLERQGDACLTQLEEVTPDTEHFGHEDQQHVRYAVVTKSTSHGLPLQEGIHDVSAPERTVPSGADHGTSRSAQTTVYSVTTRTAPLPLLDDTPPPCEISHHSRIASHEPLEVDSSKDGRTTRRVVVRTVTRPIVSHLGSDVSIPSGMFPADESLEGHRTALDESGTRYYYRVSTHAVGEEAPELHLGSEASSIQPEFEGVADITESSSTLPGSCPGTIIVRQTVRSPKHTVEVTTYETGPSEGERRLEETAQGGSVDLYQTYPEREEFYRRVECTAEDTQLPPEGSDPEEILRFMAAQTEKAAKEMLRRPVYEETEEDEERRSTRSASPVIEEQVYVQELRPDYPELIQLSGGTTPSDPQSPRSPLDIRARLNGEYGISPIQRSVVLEETESCGSTVGTAVRRPGTGDDPSGMWKRVGVKDGVDSSSALSSEAEAAERTSVVSIHDVPETKEHHYFKTREGEPAAQSEGGLEKVISVPSTERCSATTFGEDVPREGPLPSYTGSVSSGDTDPNTLISSFKVQDRDKPLGLPTPPDVSRSRPVRPPIVFHETSFRTGPAPQNPLTEFKIRDRDQPLGLPTPPDSSRSNDSRKTSKLSKPDDAVYVDLTYVPHHGDPQYCGVEFFNRVRARYYVLSGTSPSQDVLNALLEAKRSWGEPDVPVTVIPTYETDTLCYWIALNQEALEEQKIDVAPSASRCTINLQNHETSCAAYRLEF